MLGARSPSKVSPEPIASAIGSIRGNLPVMVCNAIMASGMSYLADLMEKGLSHRDAVAQLFKACPVGREAELV